jgi:hypothetical protein
LFVLLRCCCVVLCCVVLGLFRCCWIFVVSGKEEKRGNTAANPKTDT